MTIVERGVRTWFGNAVRGWSVDTVSGPNFRYVHPLEAEHYSFRTTGTFPVKCYTPYDMRNFEPGRYCSIHCKEGSPGIVEFYTGANLALVATVQPGFWAEFWLISNNTPDGTWEVRQLWENGRAVQS